MLFVNKQIFSKEFTNTAARLASSSFQCWCLLCIYHPMERRLSYSRFLVDWQEVMCHWCLFSVEMQQEGDDQSWIPVSTTVAPCMIKLETNIIAVPRWARPVYKIGSSEAACPLLRTNLTVLRFEATAATKDSTLLVRFIVMLIFKAPGELAVYLATKTPCG